MVSIKNGMYYILKFGASYLYVKNANKSHWIYELLKRSDVLLSHRNMLDDIQSQLAELNPSMAPENPEALHLMQTIIIIALFFFVCLN